MKKFKTLKDLVNYDASEITDPIAKKQVMIGVNIAIAGIALRRAEVLLNEKYPKFSSSHKAANRCEGERE